MSIRAAKKNSKAGQKAVRTGKTLARPIKGPTQPAVPDAAEPSASRPFPVVGAGASAGGLEAFTALLKALPDDTGMAFVLVQHMDPAHGSALSKILSKATGMPVDEVTDGMAVKPNHVYVMPANADMTIRHGILRLAERLGVEGRHLPIDRFPGSLAEDQKSAAIGIILSSPGLPPSGWSDYAEAIVETIPEPLLVLDGEMCVLSANTSFCQTFRTSAQETMGRSIFEQGDGQWNIPRLRQLFEQLLPQDTRIDDFEVDHEFPAIGHRHVLLNARQIHREGAGTGMILLAIKDITEQVEARKALQAGEARYRAIVEDQTELICRFLPDGTLTFVNDALCRYLGKGQGELIGHNFLDELLSEVDQEAVRQHLATFSPESPVQTLVRQMTGPNRPWRQWVTRSFFDDRGRIVEFQSAGRDVTELKQSEAALLLYQQELRALTAKLISVQEESNKHLARELHDVFSQKLAVLGMEITALEHRVTESPEALGNRLRQIAEQIGGLAKDIHQMSRQLHPAILDDLGLAAALNNECLAFAEQYGIPVEFTAQNVQEPIPEDVSLCLYRVAQESWRNIGKHAGATEVRAALSGGSEEIALVIEDFGDGFDLEEVRGKGGLGLVSMDERVRLVDGTFSIRSEPGRGTRVEVRVPLRRGKA